ncbi:MAG: hypothetical protein DRN47_05060 [Candidatus Wolframiiraptor sp.]|nr:MAG: hypothetical protein DRN47_05060 [Candidatus Wolframiiraptor sp.]
MYVRIAATKFILEWITESLASIYGIKEVIYSGETKYQKVDIVRTHDFGLVLLLDGLLQSAEIDEYVVDAYKPEKVNVTEVKRGLVRTEELQEVR